MTPTDQMENEILHSDAILVMEHEFQNLLVDLRAFMSKLVRLFGSQNDTSKEPNIGKYLLTNPNNLNVAKCMVTIKGNSIQEADLALKLSKNQGMLYQSRIYPEKSWRLQQLQDSLNQIKEAESLVNDSDVEGVVPSHRFAQNFLGEIMYCLKGAKDSLMLPRRRTLEELIKNPSNRCFNPALPNEIVASFYVQECKLTLAVYHLCTNQNGRVDIANRHQTECIVPWLNDVINILIYSLWKCQQLKNKLDILELIKD